MLTLCSNVSQCEQFTCASARLEWSLDQLGKKRRRRRKRRRRSRRRRRRSKRRSRRRSRRRRRQLKQKRSKLGCLN